MTRLAPDERCAIRDAPAVDVEHRDDRQHAIDRTQPEHVGRTSGRRRGSGCCGGCRAHLSAARWFPTCSTGCWPSSRPAPASRNRLVGRLHQLLVAVQRLTRRELATSGISARSAMQRRPLAHSGISGRDRLEYSPTKLRSAHSTTLPASRRMNDDVVRRQPRIDGMDDRSHARRGIIEFESGGGCSKPASPPGRACSTPKRLERAHQPARPKPRSEG